jgi:hypothetical protein
VIVELTFRGGGQVVAEVRSFRVTDPADLTACEWQEYADGPTLDVDWPEVVCIVTRKARKGARP